MSGRTPADVAAALADPLRMTVLARLLDGPAAVTELVVLTGEAQSKISNHLAVLRGAGLVAATRLGRQRLYEIAEPAVAQLVESLLDLGGRRPARLEKSPALAAARTCYDHLAGRLGVGLFDALVARKAIEQPEPRYRGPLSLGPAGARIFGGLGIALDEVRKERRQFATACGDWTERRPHLGGALGAAVWAACLDRGWVVQKPGTRVVVVTGAGRRGFSGQLGVQA